MRPHVCTRINHLTSIYRGRFPGRGIVGRPGEERLGESAGTDRDHGTGEEQDAVAEGRRNSLQ